jgi:hypothetical protein
LQEVISVDEGPKVEPKVAPKVGAVVAKGSSGGAGDRLLMEGLLHGVDPHDESETASSSATEGKLAKEVLQVPEEKVLCGDGMQSTTSTVVGGCRSTSHSSSHCRSHRGSFSMGLVAK